MRARQFNPLQIHVPLFSGESQQILFSKVVRGLAGSTSLQRTIVTRYCCLIKTNEFVIRSFIFQ